MLALCVGRGEICSLVITSLTLLACTYSRTDNFSSTFRLYECSMGSTLNPAYFAVTSCPALGYPACHSHAICTAYAYLRFYTYADGVASVPTSGSRRNSLLVLLVARPDIFFYCILRHPCRVLHLTIPCICSVRRQRRQCESPQSCDALEL